MSYVRQSDHKIIKGEEKFEGDKCVYKLAFDYTIPNYNLCI